MIGSVSQGQIPIVRSLARLIHEGSFFEAGERGVKV